MSLNLADIRHDYVLQGLAVEDCHRQPLHQLQQWLSEAIDGGVNEPTAMNLATVDSDNRPNARIVLLKGITQDHLRFYTNYASRKGHCLAANPWVAATLFWPELERQVRIEGCISKLPEADSDAYFASRPYGSRIGAWVSEQSQPIDSIDTLAARTLAFQQQYPDVVPRPPHWGGYALTPTRVEFWQGRPSRLHDRVLFLPTVSSFGNEMTTADTDWTRIRLQP